MRLWASVAEALSPVPRWDQSSTGPRLVEDSTVASEVLREELQGFPVCSGQSCVQPVCSTMPGSEGDPYELPQQRLVLY